MKHTVSMKENHLFRRLYNKGQSTACPTLAVYVRRNGRRESRLGLTVGTKVGKAHIRNRIRRRCRESLRRHPVKQGYDLVVVARSAAAEARFALLDRHLASLLKRLELLA